MSMYHCIAIGIDGTPESLHAAKQALNLLEPGGKAVFISVASDEYLIFYDAGLEGLEVGGAAFSAFEKTVAEVVAKAGELGIETELRMDVGQVYKTILDAAHAVEADIIVLGGSTENEFKQRLLGGTATKVIGYADRDVLVIPKHAEVGLERILAATDGSAHGKNAVRKALDLAKKSGGKLDIIRVVEETDGLPAIEAFPGGWPLFDTRESAGGAEPPRFKDFMEQKIQDVRQRLQEEFDLAGHAGVEATILTPTGRPWEELVRSSQCDGKALMVMGTHGRTGLKRLLMGSVTQRVIEHADCPVLVTK